MVLNAKSESSVVRLLQQCRFQSVVAADKDGQDLRVGASHNTGCVGFVVDRNVVIREGVAAVVELVGVDDCAVPVLDLAAGVVFVGLDVWLYVAVLDEECAAVVSCAQARHDCFVHVVVVFKNTEWTSIASKDVFRGGSSVGPVVTFAVEFHRGAARGVERAGRIADGVARAVERRARVVASVARVVERRARVVTSVAGDVASTTRKVRSVTCVVEGASRVVARTTREVDSIACAVETARVVTSTTCVVASAARTVDSAAQGIGGGGLPGACHIASCRLSVDCKGICGEFGSGFVGVGVPVIRESRLVDGDAAGRRENTQKFTLVVVDAELIPRLAVFLGLIDQVIADLVLAARW